MPGTTVGACSARPRCRAPWQWWLRRWSPRPWSVLGARRVGPAATRASARRRPDPTQPLVPRIRSITPGLHPRQGPDRHPRHAHQRVRPDVDRDQRRTGFMGSHPDHHDRRAGRRGRAPRSTPTSATGSPCPALSTASPRSPRGRARRSRSGCRSPRCRCRHRASTGSASTCSATTARVARGWRVGRDRTFLPYVPQSALPNAEHEDAALVVPVRAGVARGPDGAVVDPGVWAQSLRSGPLHDAGRDREGGERTPADLAGRPGRARRRTPSGAGQPGPHARGSAEQTGQGHDVAERRPRPPRARPAHPAPRRRSRPPPPPARPSAGSSSSTRCSAPTPARSWAFRTATSPSTARPRTTGPLLARRSSAPATPCARGACPLSTGRRARPTAARRATRSRRLPQRHHRAAARHRRSTDQTPADQPGRRPPGGPRLAGAAAGRARPGRPAELAGAAPADPGRGRPAGPRRPAAARGGAADGHAPPLRPSFFSGLDVPWLRLTTLDGATAGSPTPLDATRLRGAVVRTARSSDPDLYADGAEHPGARQQARSRCCPSNDALRQASCSTRPPATRRTPRSAEPLLALSRMRGTDHWVDATTSTPSTWPRPESVTLASTSGRFSAIVSNELDVPVTVKVRAVSDPQLHDHRRRGRARCRRTAAPRCCSTPRPTSAASTP